MSELTQKLRSSSTFTLILGDPGAESGGKGKSKRAEKYTWNEEK